MVGRRRALDSGRTKPTALNKVRIDTTVVRLDAPPSANRRGAVMKHLLGLAALVSVVAVVGTTASTSAQAWRQRRFRLRVEPHGGRHAERASAACGRGSARGAGGDGDGRGRGLRRGQRDHAEALPAIPAGAAFRRDRLDRCRGRNRRIRGPREHRLHGSVDLRRRRDRRRCNPSPTSYASSLAGVDDGPSKTEGVDAGHAAAEAMIAARQNDGRFGPSQWVPNFEPGALVAVA